MPRNDNLFVKLRKRSVHNKSANAEAIDSLHFKMAMPVLVWIRLVQGRHGSWFDRGVHGTWGKRLVRHVSQLRGAQP